MDGQMDLQELSIGTDSMLLIKHRKTDRQADRLRDEQTDEWRDGGTVEWRDTSGIFNKPIL